MIASVRGSDRKATVSYSYVPFRLTLNVHFMNEYEYCEVAVSGTGGLPVRSGTVFGITPCLLLHPL